MREKLHRVVFCEAGAVANKVVRRFHGHARINDFPAALVACGCKTQGRYLVEVESSRSTANYTYVGRLSRKLLKLGSIGQKSILPTCYNRIGWCAEPHAANEVLKRIPSAAIDELQFSNAIRPRTMCTIDYCDNCKSTFPQLK